MDWSADGKYIVYQAYAQDADLYLVSLANDHASWPYASGTGFGRKARFSPDGRWIAFGSSELGSMEIFVAPFDDGTARQRVSPQGGRNPTWSPAGDELYYTHEDALYAVSFESERGALGVPHELFSLGESREVMGVEISPDGERFLIAVSDRSEFRSDITVVLGWRSMTD